MAAVLLVTTQLVAQKVSEAELQYRDALHKQQVERDLAGAIRLYEGIGASKTANRAVKAKALLQLGACYELQGRQAEAEKVYDQIVREFKDQPAILAQARTKLAALHPASSPPTVTPIRFGNGVRNVIATDGRRAVYWNDERTTLYFGDVAGNTRNTVYAAQSDNRLPFSNVLASPDLSMVFIQASQSSGKGIVKNTDGTGGREVDVAGWFKDESGATLSRFTSWSADSRYLLATVTVVGQGMHFARISVDDGRTTIVGRASDLRVVDGRRNGGAGPAVLSPDLRFVAFVRGGSLYVISLQGGEPRLVSELAVGNNTARAAWADDGKFLLFAGGPQRDSLFALPMKDGQPAGERIAIPGAGGYTAETHGASIVLRRVAEYEPSHEKLYLASLDDEGRLSRWTRQDVVGAAGIYPTWSPDSRQFAYTAPADRRGIPAVRIHTVAGEDRLLFPGQPGQPIGEMSCLWASTQPLIYCGAIARVGPRDAVTRVVSIASDTGVTREVGALNGRRFLDRLSPGDRTLVSIDMRRGPGSTSRPAAYRWDIGTNTESEMPFTAVEDFNISESPDGRWVYRVQVSGNRKQYQIRPSSGSDADWRPLMYVDRPDEAPPSVRPFIAAAPPSARPFIGAVPIQYTPDSKWIVYHDRDANGRDALFRVSTSGGEAQRLGDYPTSNLNTLISISPDGRKILVQEVDHDRSGNQVNRVDDYEFALVENLTARPAAAAPKPAAKAVKP
jgi:Tol biopolymer transport system component